MFRCCFQIKMSYVCSESRGDCGCVVVFLCSAAQQNEDRPAAHAAAAPAMTEPR